jgi:ABC-type xylose transport system permease subunit
MRCCVRNNATEAPASGCAGSRCASALFLWWIGWYNALTPLVLCAMHDERVADVVMRRVTEVAAEPYEHGPFGRLWLWWAASTNAALGAIMVLATRWPTNSQREVAIAALGVYAVMYLVMVFGARKPRYGRGIYTVHVLWIAQLGWGAWALWSS